LKISLYETQCPTTFEDKLEELDLEDELEKELNEEFDVLDQEDELEEELETELTEE
jgi:hypothetical protein